MHRLHFYDSLRKKKCKQQSIRKRLNAAENPKNMLQNGFGEKKLMYNRNKGLKRQFQTEKWTALLTFGVLYIMVYYGRFFITYFVEEGQNSHFYSPDFPIYVHSVTFLSYAVGSFFMGRFADAVRQPVVLATVGAVVSLLANVGMMGNHDSQQLLLLLIVINGVFQSMIWVNGIQLVANWWKSKERPLSGGIVNFFSGIAHIPAFFLPRITFVQENGAFSTLEFLGIFVPCVIILIFFVRAVEKPERFGLSPYEEDDLLIASREKYLREEIQQKQKSPILFFLKNKKIWCWCMVAFFSSICRYGTLECIPKYYMAVGIIPYAKAEWFTDVVLPLGMAIGTLGITYFTGRKFGKNKGIMVAICAALAGTMISVFPMMPSVGIIRMGIFSSGFFLFGINGIIWIYAMDWGGRVYSATLAGILNCFAYIGAFLQKFLFSGIIERYNSEVSVFILMQFFCFILIGLMILASEKDTNIEVEEAA